MRCNFCGHDNLPGSITCDNCFADLAAKTEPVRPPEVSAKGSPKGSPKGPPKDPIGETVYCSVCGKAVARGATFCGSCGNQTKPSSQPKPGSGSGSGAGSGAGSLSGGQTSLLRTLPIGSILIIIIGFFFLFMGGFMNQDPDALSEQYWKYGPGAPAPGNDAIIFGVVLIAIGFASLYYNKLHPSPSSTLHLVGIFSLVACPFLALLGLIYTVLYTVLEVLAVLLFIVSIGALIVDFFIQWGKPHQ